MAWTVADFPGWITPSGGVAVGWSNSGEDLAREMILGPDSKASGARDGRRMDRGPETAITRNPPTKGHGVRFPASSRTGMRARAVPPTR